MRVCGAWGLSGSKCGDAVGSYSYVFWGSGEMGPGVFVPSILCAGIWNWGVRTDGNCRTKQNGGLGHRILPNKSRKRTYTLMYWLGTGGPPGGVWLGWGVRLDWVCSRSGCWTAEDWELAAEWESEEEDHQHRVSIITLVWQSGRFYIFSYTVPANN